MRPRERKNRSRSPLRTHPAEVFSRSPRASRHYEDGPAVESNSNLSPRGGAVSGRKASPRSHVSEDRLQQQASHMNAHQLHPSGSDAEACLDWLHKNCFKEITGIEKSLEERKVALCERHDFTLETAFAQFSDSSMMRLGAAELVQGFDRMGVTCDSADARLIISRYDGDEDMRLSFWEFANLVLPIEATLRDDMERR